MTDSTIGVKACNKCGITMPLEEFHRSKSYKDGRRSTCRTCVKPQAQAYRESHREYFRDANRAWRAANPEVVLEYQQRYRRENAVVLRERTRAYQAANPDKVREWKRNYHKAHAEKICEAGRLWRKQNPEKIRAHKLANAEKIREQRRSHYAKNTEWRRAWLEANAHRTRVYANKRRALKASADCGCITPESESRVIAAYGNSCVYCGAPHEHLDHVVPLSKGGPHCVSNLRTSCASCNLSKGHSMLEVFLKRRPDLSGELARTTLLICPNQT